jgi:adenylate cyclase
MTPKNERRLSAILAADVAGYSRLMGADEAGTLADLRQLRSAVFEPVVTGYRGTVIKRMGDGWLVEFASAADAVRAAIDIQSGLVDHPRIRLRIGVHVGDIVHEAEDIFGDGVNIAARLQQEVLPGGIAISGVTRQSIRGIVSEPFHDAGARTLRNIAGETAIHTWGAGLAPVAATPHTSRGRVPSILILPFATPGGADQADWLADGLTDTLITAMSRFSWFVVQSRGTSYAHRARATPITELARDPGVSYVVDGSLRMAGNRVRVGVELVETTTGKQIWSGRFDGQGDDPFELEDRICRSILAELSPRLQGAEAERAAFAEEGSAWDMIMRGRGLLWHVNEADVARAQDYFNQAIALDPASGLGQCDLAWSYVYQRIYGWGGALDATNARVMEAATRALATDRDDAFALAALSYANTMAGQSAEAIALAERAVEVNPNLAVAHTGLSLGLFQQGRYQDSYESCETGIRLSPRDPLLSIMLAVRGMFFLVSEKADEMEANARDMVRDYPGMPTGHRQLAVALSMKGQQDRAQLVIADVLRLLPGHTATQSGQQVPFGENDTARQTWVNWLHKAGLPL